MKYGLLLLLFISGATAQVVPDWMGVQFNDGASLTTYPLTETFTAGAGGVTANILVITDSSSPANIIAATGNEAFGIVMNPAAAGGTVEVARFGQAACLVDAGGATAGDLVIAGTANVTYCKDSGQTVASNIPIGTRIIGLFRTSAPAGSTAMVELTPTQHGIQTGESISLHGTMQGTYSVLDLGSATGLNWQLSPNGQTMSFTPQLDSAVVPSKVAANSYAAGARQSVTPSASTAGLNVSGGTLPSSPTMGDIATDPMGNLNWYDGTGWRLGTVADAVLPAGMPVLGDGANHVTTGSATGNGSVVFANTPTINNPVITSFVNSNHDHSNPARGGGLSVNAFNNGTNASSSTYLRGDGSWSNLPAAPVNSVFGRTSSITAQAGDYSFGQIAGTAALNQLPGSGAVTVAGQSCALGSSCTLASVNLSDASNVNLLNANQTITGNRIYTGSIDSSGATHTLPARVGASAGRPSTCTVGEMYFATDAAAGQNWFYCTAANVWSPQLNSPPTTNQNVRRITFAFDGAGLPLSGALTRCVNVDFGGTMQQFVALGDQPGNATIKILTVALGSYAGPSSASDITYGGETIAGTAVKSDSTLSNWATSLSANTVVCAQISGESGFTWLQGEVKVAAN